MTSRFSTLLSLVAAVALAGPARSVEVWSEGSASLSFSGSLSQLGLYTHQTRADDFTDAIAADVLAGSTACVFAAEFADCPAFDTVGDLDVAQGLTRIRLRADLRATDWLSAVVVYDNEVSAGRIDTLQRGLSGNLGADTFMGAEGTIVSGKHVEWRHRLYRGYVFAEKGPLELSIGRQRIAWGVGRLWTPIDRFSALPPLTLESDVVSGIDSVDARWNFNGFNYLQWVYSPGANRRDSRFAARLHGVFRDADLSLMGGIFEEAPTVGFDFARNIGDAALRIEAVWTDPERDVWKIGDAAPRELGQFWQVVVSYDINLDMGTGLYLLAEYLYNGNALGFGSGRAGTLLAFFEAAANPGIGGPLVEPATADIFGTSRVITSAEHQLGIQTGYDISPEIRGDFITLVDLDGGSAAFFPNISYAPFDAVELNLGVQLFVGPRLSQYGGQEHRVYVRGEFFF